jgi:hypothetical protein
VGGKGGKLTGKGQGIRNERDHKRGIFFHGGLQNDPKPLEISSFREFSKMHSKNVKAQNDDSQEWVRQFGQ